MRRLAAVVALSLGGFVAALATFSGEMPGPCGRAATGSGSYDAEFDTPVTLADERYTLTVTREGEAVADARVCVRAEAVDRAAASVSAEAVPDAAGRYEVPLDFPDAGAWHATVLVSERDDAVGVAVAVPLEVVP